MSTINNIPKGGISMATNAMVTTDREVVYSWLMSYLLDVNNISQVTMVTNWDVSPILTTFTAQIELHEISEITQWSFQQSQRTIWPHASFQTFPCRITLSQGNFTLFGRRHPFWFHLIYIQSSIYCNQCEAHSWKACLWISITHHYCKIL